MIVLLTVLENIEDAAGTPGCSHRGEICCLCLTRGFRVGIIHRTVEGLNSENAHLAGFPLAEREHAF